MVPPGIIQNREWPDREWSDREWSTTETRLGEIRLTEVRRPGKGLLPIKTITNDFETRDWLSTLMQTESDWWMEG